MFGISGTELFIIAIFAFVIFGPDKIPEIARTVSKTIAMFKHTQEEMERQIRAEMHNIDPSLGEIFPGSSTSAPAPSGSKSAAGASDTAGMQGVVDEEEEDEE